MKKKILKKTKIKRERVFEWIKKPDVGRNEKCG